MLSMNMAEKGVNGFRPRVFVEAAGSFGWRAIFADNEVEAKKREENREMVKREERFSMRDLIRDKAA